jgi:hypothetical protein
VHVDTITTAKGLDGLVPGVTVVEAAKQVVQHAFAQGER